ncbi:GntR family transcriptional regulator [Lacticaseibacillus sp. GG6-2]
MKESISFQDDAYNQIQDMILHFELKPGERINKKNLEERLNLKIAPVRQAIAMLGRVGLVDVYAQSGSYVSKISIKAVYQACLMRETMERMVVAQVISSITPDQIQSLHTIINLQNIYMKSNDYTNFFNADDQFHESFYVFTDNLFIWNWLQEANLQFNRLRFLRLEMHTPDWPLLIEEHSNIINCIETKDIKGAQAAISHHLESVREDVKMARQAYPDYFFDDEN